MSASKYPPQKAPPKTKARTEVVKEQTAPYVVTLAIQVLPDGTDGTITAGHTTFRWRGELLDDNKKFVLFRGPGYVSQIDKNKETVTKIIPAEIRGTMEIKTLYGPDASPSQESAYGRGTTERDRLAGDTSLGFHEACHQIDFINYLKTKPLPAFAGKIGMTVVEFRQAAAKFREALTNYFSKTAIEGYSNQLTHEVGTKKSVYDAKRAKKPKPTRR